MLRLRRQEMSGVRQIRACVGGAVHPSQTSRVHCQSGTGAVVQGGRACEAKTKYRHSLYDQLRTAIPDAAQLGQNRNAAGRFHLKYPDPKEVATYVCLLF